MIAAHIETLFPGMEIVAEHPFRVTRDADVEVEIDEADDLLEAIESIVRRRERSPEAVRLEVAPVDAEVDPGPAAEELGLTTPTST